METFDILKFRRGDEHLFQNIVETYGERIYHIVLRVVRNSDDAEDIVQETFARAFMKRKTFRGKSSVYTWLVRIAYNIALNTLRSRHHTVEIHPGIPSDSNPEADVQRKELAERITDAVEQLPRKQKMVFALRFHEKLPYKEISRIMRCKVGTAKALYHFALEKLSNKLDDYHPRKTEKGKTHEELKERI